MVHTYVSCEPLLSFAFAQGKPESLSPEVRQAGMSFLHCLSESINTAHPHPLWLLQHHASCCSLLCHEHALHIIHNSAAFVSLNGGPLPKDMTFVQEEDQQHCVWVIAFCLTADWDCVNVLFCARTLITWSWKIFNIKLNNWVAWSRWCEGQKWDFPWSIFDSHASDYIIWFLVATRFFSPSSL